MRLERRREAARRDVLCEPRWWYLHLVSQHQHHQNLTSAQPPACGPLKRFHPLPVGGSRLVSVAAVFVFSVFSALTAAGNLNRRPAAFLVATHRQSPSLFPRPEFLTFMVLVKRPRRYIMARPLPSIQPLASRQTSRL